MSVRLSNVGKFADGRNQTRPRISLCPFCLQLVNLVRWTRSLVAGKPKCMVEQEWIGLDAFDASLRRFNGLSGSSQEGFVLNIERLKDCQCATPLFCLPVFPLYEVLCQYRSVPWALLISSLWLWSTPVSFFFQWSYWRRWGHSVLWRSLHQVRNKRVDPRSWAHVVCSAHFEIRVSIFLGELFRNLSRTPCDKSLLNVRFEQFIFPGPLTVILLDMVYAAEASVARTLMMGLRECFTPWKKKAKWWSLWVSILWPATARSACPNM